MSRTKLYQDSTDTLISEKITYIRPQQETTEVINILLDGTQHLQTIGNPRHSYELEFITTAEKQDKINGYAANKNSIRLERYGKKHIGIIQGNPDWEQIKGSSDPAKAMYKCKITMAVIA